MGDGMQDGRGARRPSGRAAVAGVLALALLSSSCAYYNTFYLAKKYYVTATGGMPYPVEKPSGAQTGNYQRSIDYSKKVIANYPKSKWVDDAYLLWAQALLGKDDPLQTANMLLDFPTRYPASSRKDEAMFYLGVAYRQARKHHEALIALDAFLVSAPKHDLAPYAHLERSRTLMSLARPTEAAGAASEVIDRFPKSTLGVRARAARAEALLAAGDPAGARADFQALGLRALDDAERFSFLLREADCLEAARDYDGGLALLNAALAHEPAPVKTLTGAAPTGPGVDRYGQLTLRIGTIHLLAGRPDEALTAYRNVLQDYPKTALAAEAQYRIAYTHETALDDFDTARQEYAKVRDQSVGSAFFAQATLRQQSLDRLARFRGAGSDSLERQLEAGFLLAEQYLFQLDKPERAREAYAAIVREHAGSPPAAKAMNAEAWVLRRKLDRPAEADSLLWRVVREYPATEAQLAARDYLEAGGHQVPVELIRLPAPPPGSRDTTTRLAPAPSGPATAGSPPGEVRPALPAAPDSLPGPAGAPLPRLVEAATGPDSLRPYAGSPPTRAGAATGTGMVSRADTTRRAAADTTRRAAADTTRRAPADTTGRAAADTTRRAPADTTARPPARWIPSDTLRWRPR